MKKKSLTYEERRLSYSKYYDLPLTPVSYKKLKYIENPIDPTKALKFEDRNDIFKPGYLEEEIGWCILENGAGYLSNLTYMPNVTKEMFEWWFAWHSLEDLRYRIWDPEDHYYARQMDREKTLNKDLPMRERTWGTTHDVLEDIGGGPETLFINFRYPSELGFDEDKVGTDLCASMMCANGHGPVPGEGSVAIMLHTIRELDSGGIELRSRFWLGYGFDQNGNLRKLLPDGITIPSIAPQALFAHNCTEFTHLGTILPMIYEENKDNW